MTAPTMTYGHGLLNDCHTLTDMGSEVRLNMDAGHVTESIIHGDFFQIQVQFNDGATQEYTYFLQDVTNISTDVYTRFLVRYKTSVAANGARAKIIVEFTSGSQTILAASYSSTWATASGALTSGKTIDKVRWYAEDDGTDGTFTVWYDFCLFHKGTFTFPFVAPGGLSVRFPQKTQELDVSGRDGGVIQKPGMKSPQITLRGSMDDAGAWGTPDGEYLYYVTRDSDPWQWFTSDIITGKVVIDEQGLLLSQDPNSRAQRTWELPLKVTSLASLGESTYDGKEWFQ